MYPLPLVIDEKYVGFDELLRGESASAIDYMKQLALGCLSNEQTVKYLYRYMLLYATYSFSSLTLTQVSELWDEYRWAVEDRATRNLIMERLVARCRFERKVATGASRTVQNSYAMGLGITQPDQPGLPVFGISIPRLVDRQFRLFANACQLGCNTLEFSGVDAKTIQSVPSFIWPDAPLGTVANIISHRNIWQEIVDRRIEVAMILEDDALLVGIPSVHQWEQELQELDVVFLNNRVLPDYQTVPKISGDSDESYLLPVCFGCGTEGYLITMRGAKRLLQLFEKATAPIDVQIMAHLDLSDSEDEDIQKCRATRSSDIRLVCRRIFPFLVEHPPANYSTAWNRTIRGFCPGLWVAGHV